MPPPPPRKFDLVFSKMLAEHVKDGKRFHQNARSLLADGGRAFHFFPTLFALPLLVNKLLPEAISDWILHITQPERYETGKTDKFPAYYDWCYGPMPSQIKRLESLGYQVEEYTGYFGHEYYRKIPFMQTLIDALARYLVQHPVPCYTISAYVLLRKI